jgi:hypothetical protein
VRAKKQTTAVEQAQPSALVRVVDLIKTLNNSQKPSPRDIDELIGLLRDNEEITRYLPGISTVVLNTLIAKFTKGTGNNTAYKAKIELMRHDLGIKDATGIERHLIERVIICWLHLQQAELQLALTTEGTFIMKEAEYQDRMVMRAHARYIRAVESLERVRAMVKANKLLDAQTREAESRADIWQARKPKPLRLAGSNAR